MPFQLAGLVFVLAAAAGTLALASISASSRLTNFGYTLIDLNPDDGIAPAVRFDTFGYGSGAGTGVWEGLAPDSSWGDGLPGRSYGFMDPFHLFRQGNWEMSSPHAAASSRMSGDVADRSFSAVVEGVARNTRGDDPRLGVGFGAVAVPSDGDVFFYDSQAIALTPYTEMVWTGQLQNEVEATVGHRNGRWEAVTAWTRMELFNQSAGTSDKFVGLTYTDKYERARRSESFDIRLSFANPTANSAHGFLRSQVEVQGSSFLPVPEPGTPWLMLCGAAVLAGVARTRHGYRCSIPGLQDKI